MWFGKLEIIFSVLKDHGNQSLTMVLASSNSRDSSGNKITGNTKKKKEIFFYV